MQSLQHAKSRPNLSFLSIFQFLLATSRSQPSGIRPSKKANSVGFRLSEDANLNVINNLDPVAPSGVTQRTVPYAIMLAAGLTLVVSVILGGKRRKHENG